MPVWAQYGVGTCNINVIQKFSTIQAAVNSVPVGSTILVCPGLYPEQVTISQPLTLRGVASGNSSRATIAINPEASFGSNVTIFVPLYAQVLVKNVEPAGPVNIVGITVDGYGFGASPAPCLQGGGGTGLAGIVYSAGTTGTVNEVSTRNHQVAGCGFGILAFNASDTSQTITVANSSVHDFDYGIFTSAAPAQALLATIQGNFLNAGNGHQTIGNWGAITAFAASDSIAGNFATGGQKGIDIEHGADGYPSTAINNAIADAGVGVILYNSASVSLGNRISDVGTGIQVQNDDTGPDGIAAPTIQGNLIQNAAHAIDFVSFSPFCPAGLVVTQNIFNDSSVALNHAPASGINGNQLDNLDVVFVPGVCP
jgi:hypothetical protein